MQTLQQGWHQKLQNFLYSSLNSATPSNIAFIDLYPVQPVLKISENTCWLYGTWTEILMCSCVNLQRENSSCRFVETCDATVNVNKSFLMSKAVFYGAEVLFVSFCYLVNWEQPKIQSKYFLL
jgi:hypothetical protein